MGAKNWKDRVVGGKVTDEGKTVVTWAAHEADVTVSRFVADAALDRALEQLADSEGGDDA